MVDRVTKAKGGAGGRVWGCRKLVIISQVGKGEVEQVSVKVELVSGEMAMTFVKGYVVFLGLRKEVELEV